MENKIVGRITNPKDKDGVTLETVVTLTQEEGEIIFQAVQDPDLYLVVDEKQLKEWLK